MNGDSHLAWWKRAYIHLVDIRYCVVEPGDEQAEYRLPTHALLLVSGRHATVKVNCAEYTIEGSCVLHVVKGQRFAVSSVASALQYYMILYRARHVFSYRGSARGGLSASALNGPYVFVPDKPAILWDKAEHMRMEWGRSTELAHIYCKGLFYQLAAELLAQLQSGGSDAEGGEVAERVVRYLHEHYSEPIGLEHIAERFHYSSRYLSKLFKKHTGSGIIEYVISLRIRLAQRLLLGTDDSVSRIAASVGYSDLFYFTRLFKKHTGVSPNHYRMQASDAPVGVHNAKERTALSIESLLSQDYSRECSEKHSQKEKRERTTMVYRNRPAKAATILLALTLLLAACGGTQSAPAGTGAPSGQPAAAATPAASGGAQAAEQAFPRTYVDSTGKEVVLEKRPERIAVGHFAEMEYFFALGVPPVASPLAAEILQEFEVTLGEFAKEAQVADLGDVMSPNLEKLLEKQPDLIIGSVGLHEEVYDQLQQIAPVVMLNLTGNWKESLTEYAAIIGREEKAAAYIDELTAEMKQANEQLKPLQGETVAFFRIAGENEFGVMGKVPYGYFFDDNEGLGLSAPEGYPDKWEVLSLEGLSTMDADHIVLFDTAASYEQKLAEYERSKVWNGLRAVQNGNVHFLDIASATNGPYAIKYAVRQLTDSLLKP